MALSWLRRHQKSVLKPLAVVVIITFVLFYGGSKLGKQRGGGGRLRFSIGERTIEEGELRRLGYVYSLLFGRTFDDQSIFWGFLVPSEIAKQVGVKSAPRTVEKTITALLKQRLGTDTLDQAAYQEFLQQHNVTGAELQGVVADHAASQELTGVIKSSALFSSKELYTAFRRERQELTFHYRDFPVKDFVDTVDEPTDEEIKAHHATFSVLPESNKDALVHPSRYRFTYVLADREAFAEKAALTDEEIKEHYDKLKELYKIDGEDGAEATYKPLEEVKKEVEEDLRERRGRTLAAEALAAARKELEEGITALVKEAEKPETAPEEKIRKLFVSAAEKHNLKEGVVDWTTKDGLKSVETLGNISTLGTFLTEDPKAWSNLIPDARSEKGPFAAVVLGMEPSEPMPLEEARPEIIRRIKWKVAQEEAAKAAFMLIDSILTGKKSSDLLNKEYTEIARKLKGKERFLAVGEVSVEPVAHHADEEDEAYRVVLLVNRKAPTRTDFEKDAFYARTTMALVAYSRPGFFTGSWFQYWITVFNLR